MRKTFAATCALLLAMSAQAKDKVIDRPAYVSSTAMYELNPMKVVTGIGRCAENDNDNARFKCGHALTSRSDIHLKEIYHSTDRKNGKGDNIEPAAAFGFDLPGALVQGKAYKCKDPAGGKKYRSPFVRGIIQSLYDRFLRKQYGRNKHRPCRDRIIQRFGSQYFIEFFFEIQQVDNRHTCKGSGAYPTELNLRFSEQKNGESRSSTCDVHISPEKGDTFFEKGSEKYKAQEHRSKGNSIFDNNGHILFLQYLTTAALTSPSRPLLIGSRVPSSRVRSLPE